MKPMLMFYRLAMTARIAVLPAPTFGEGTMMRKLNRIRSLIGLLVTISLVTVLTGCLHPCELFSCTRTIKAVAFTGNDGNINIDVQESHSDQNATLHHIGIQTMPASADPQCCWEIAATLPVKNNRVEFPIRYGQDVDGMKTTIPARPLTKGRRYQITGWINWVENGELVSARIAGEFRYDDQSLLNK